MKEDIKSLALCSEMAQKALLNGKKAKVLNFYDAWVCGSEINDDFEDFSFHPNGKCGCLLANDTDFFGIRCDHLMWSEGFCEGVEKFWEFNLSLSDIDEKNLSEVFNAILVYGNHKGRLISKLIIFVDSKR